MQPLSNLDDSNFIDTETTIAEAKKYDAAGYIHKNDFVFAFHLEGREPRTIGQATEIYFTDGCRSAEKLKSIVGQFLPGRTGLTLLDFASGYGCVARHLVKEHGLFDVTACDIHADAVDFLRNHVGVTAVISATRPEELCLPRRFDVVLALSFFSHIPPSTFGRWLDVLLDRVEDKGLLIFTTHGRSGQAAVDVASLGAEHCWFAPVSEQHDLPTSDYGTMIVTPSFALGAIEHRSDCVLKFFQEADWWGYQDTYIVQKIDNGVAAGLHPAAGFLRRAALEDQVSKLTRVVEVLRESTSWRVTAPLRKIGSTFRRDAE